MIQFILKFHLLLLLLVGFSNKIVNRNNAKNNDDIYVTGNLGDSLLGLKFFKK